ncbi:MAG: TPM domain-containing protein [Nitrospirae bacterium]|nr:TPM domain-containing protein [Nitrospirota bacterium]
MKHGLKAERFFTAEEKKRIKEATRDVEARSIGEVAVMVVESSDHYFEAEIIGGILFAGLFSLIMTVLFFRASVWFYVPLCFLAFFPFRLLFRKAPALKSAFIGVRRKEHAVRLRAIRAFYEKGLYKTRNNTGILFLVSLFERKVRVLADSGIHEKIGQETLNGFARGVSRGIREGRASDALCDAIREAGELLSRHFPLGGDDTNELSDDVMTG